MTKRITLTLLLAGACTLWFALPTPAVQIGAQTAGPPQAPDDGITVTAVGSATAVADRVSVRLRVRCRAKSVAQALTDFQAKSTLLEKTLADFSDLGVELVRSGVQIGLKQADPNNFVMSGEEPTAPPFEAAERVTVTFSAENDPISAVVDIIEAAGDVDCELDADSGVNPYAFFYGGGEAVAPPVSFHVSKEQLAQAREAAFKAAFDDAQAQAAAFAAIAGRRAGRAESIRVVKAFPEAAPTSGAGRREIEIAVRFGLVP